MFQSIFLQILNLFFKANILDYQNYISVSSLGCGLGRQGGVIIDKNILFVYFMFQSM